MSDTTYDLGRKGPQSFPKLPLSITSALTLSMAFGTIGAVLGLLIGFDEVEGHRYVEIGYRRNLILVLRTFAFVGAALGALLGLGFGLLRMCRGLLVVARLASGLLPVWIALFVAFTIILAREALADPITLPRVLVTLCVLAAWFGSYLRWQPLGLRPLQLQWSADGLLLVPAGFAVAIVVFERAMLGRALASLGVVWICVVVLIGVWALLALDRPARGRVGRVFRVGLAVLPILAVIVRVIPVPQFPHGLDAGNRNVILIAIDTLRADHTTPLPPASGTRDLTPELRAFAQRGTVFTRAISQAPWTMPAFASVLTGRYPSQHQATSFGAALRDREVTLAETLREAGYRTVGVVSHSIIGAGYGFHQGFDVYDEELALGHRAVTSDLVTDKALQFLGEAGSEPFFLFAHYFDPHYEYRDHEEWDYSDNYNGWLTGSPFNIHGLRNARHRLTAADRAHLVDRYDEEIAFTDREIGRLLRRITEEFPTAVVVIVADHGEEFFEHGWLGHTTTLHDEVVAVPLVAYLPDVESAASVVADTVETRSVFATLLESAGVELPDVDAAPSYQAQFRGDGAGFAFSQVHLLEVNRGSGKHAFLSSLRTNSATLIYDHLTMRHALYELEGDPHELTVLPVENRPGLQLKLEEWLAGPGLAEGRDVQEELSPQRRQQLRDLGYVE